MTQEKGLLVINERKTLPRGELWFEYSHSSGPGGQNVNKVSSRVTVCLNLDLSPSLTEGEKARLRVVLQNRINREGILRVNCEESRSQTNNRELAILRLLELLAGGLLRPRRRKASRPTHASRETRLAGKKQRSSLKAERRQEPDHSS